MNAPRIYPARLAPRERKLLGDALAALSVPVRRESEDVRSAISHRLACATRYDEMREKRLSERERFNARVTLRCAVLTFVETGDAERARDAARALVRLLR